MVRELKPQAGDASKRREFRRERLAAMCLRLIGPVAHFLSRPTQDRSDAMFRHADRGADFLVALSFQMIHPHDVSFPRIKTREQLLDFFHVFDPSWLILNGCGFVGHVGRNWVLGTEASHNDAASDHRQIGGKRAISPEPAQDRKIIHEQSHKDICDQIITS